MSVSALGANTAPLNTYSSLGSASEVRAELLSNNVSDTKTKGANKSEEKAKDAKCGEGNAARKSKTRRGAHSKEKIINNVVIPAKERICEDPDLSYLKVTH